MRTCISWILAGAVILGTVTCDHHEDSEDKVWGDCTEDPVRGTCDKWVVRWFFNNDTGLCDRFWFGGCEEEAGKNNYKSIKDCNTSCLPNTKGTENIKIGVDDATVKPKEKTLPIQPVSGVCTSMDMPVTTLCTEWKVKWAYNKEKEICDRFWFGGCEGVANKFDSEKECEDTCKPTIKEDVCIQPVVTGRCRARHRRWYYNKDRRECLEFVYGGCDGNGNRFRSKDDCETTCLAGTSALGDDGCKNSRFGCCLDGKTAARTQSKQDCPNPCQSMYYGCCDDDKTPATGPNQEGCETIEISSGAEPCDQSEFGCCDDGNTAATGPSKQGCEDDHTVPVVTETLDKDVTVGTAAYCREPKEMGPCRDDPVVMWYYDTTHQKCARFWYGGCRGNNNRFKSEKECQTTCRNYVVKETTPVCEQAKEIGPCKALIPRWFFNQDTNTCEEFNYGGCRGNNNNFASVAECERQCRRGTPVSKPGRCPVVAAESNETCNANCRYDGDCPGDEKCCSLSDFCHTCSALEPETVATLDVCDMAREVGPCRAGIPRYYYNRATYTCDAFSYGGCGGNRNNFETIEDCQRRCRVRTTVVKPVTKTVTRQPVCSYAPDRGPCERTVTKYHFNLATMTCESFTYGGCLGNHNNFETEAKCQQYCGLRKSSSWKANCGLMKEEGPCKGNLQRWHYDSRTGRCYQFTYGGCQGNGNNFADERTCTSTCRGLISPETRPTARPTARPIPFSTVAPPRVEEDVCSQSLRASSQCNTGVSAYWYYNQLTGMCEEIPNGECNSNRNSFTSRRQCEGYCSQDRVCQPLTYTTDVRCLALLPRWTYNSRTGNCESFNYGGCGGSANNFMTKEACDSKCDPGSLTPVTAAPAEPVSRSEVCAMPESAGNCLAYFRKWRYDSLNGQCVEFTYGGCGGNKNNFDTREECENFCSRPVVCQAFEEPEISCLAYYSRWRFDVASRQCENFVYGGCGGNANNFETIEACERKCNTQPEVVDNTVVDNGQSNTWRDICNLQADVGPCKQYIRKWHFNGVSQTCEEFTYGGCLGNHNNFESKLQCMTYCDPSRSGGSGGGVRPVTEAPEIEGSGEVLPTAEPETGVDVCHLESETGQCRAFIRVWFYNHLSGQCEQFVYGGCHGNNNRFATQQECEATCSPREVCILPQQSGNCMSYIRRWFFDYNEQRCKEFAYGGCDGNANNFETQEGCETRCEPLMRARPPDVIKEGTCPSLQNNTESDGKCMEQCRKDGDCDGSKKCCTVACSLVCVEPDEVAPTVVTPRDKAGYCPPRTDWQGLLGACAPQCQDDSTCPSDYKCCHHGCGYRCIAPVDEEPYQMDAPARVGANTVSNDAIHLTWYDPSLGREQLIRDGRYYTIRYHSYSLGQYNYMNVTDLRGHVNGLQENTEYEFSVRVNNPPYLSNWSSVTRNTTRQRAVVKGGACPAVGDDQLGICVEECQNDGDCGGSKKCCSNGCGRTCMNPQGFDVCTLPTDPGSCSNWEVRWYFNSEKQICDRFWYGGCNEGNENNFMDDDECKRRCIGIPAPPVTAAPYDCRRTMFGCCADGYTGALDAAKSNCREMTTEAPYDCRRTRFGCCDDGYNTATDAARSNCPENQQDRETIVPATPGESVVIDCRSGPNVTWYRDGYIVETNARLRVNSDGTIQVFQATIEDDGIYACHVPGDYGTSTIYRYVLQVRVPIGILPGPAQILVKPNHQAFLHCEVYGNPKPAVTWQRYGGVIQNTAESQTFSNGTLLIYKATEADQGQYTCTADNRVSQSASRTIELMLREMLVARIENDNGRVMEGSKITITCEGRGFPQPSVTWEKSGKPLTSNGNVFISNSGRLVVRDSTLDDSGVYTCIVANNVEKIETSTSVQVVPKSMPDDKCEDRTSLMKCRLIVTARLCGYAMYSKICCNSCLNFFTHRA